MIGELVRESFLQDDNRNACLKRFHTEIQTRSKQLKNEVHQGGYGVFGMTVDIYFQTNFKIQCFYALLVCCHLKKDNQFKKISKVVSICVEELCIMNSFHIAFKHVMRNAMDFPKNSRRINGLQSVTVSATVSMTEL